LKGMDINCRRLLQYPMPNSLLKSYLSGWFSSYSQDGRKHTRLDMLSFSKNTPMLGGQARCFPFFIVLIGIGVVAFGFT
jgi:hypothetical protein